MTGKKKVVMRLAGEDGNAFMIMGRFSREARRQGWTREDVNAVLDLVRGGDYNNLLRVMIENTEEPLHDEDEPVCDSCEALGSDCECENPSFESGRRS